MFLNIRQDGRGATQAAMDETKRLTEACFKLERDPLGRRWAPLAPSTIRRRPPGPTLAGLLPDLSWKIIGLGRWACRSNLKPYAVYHLGPDKRTGRPERPFQPVQRGADRVWGVPVYRALHGWLDLHRTRVGL